LPFFWVNYITLAASIIVLGVAPLFILIYYLCKFKKWNSDDFDSQMGACLDGLRKDTRFAVFYPTFFMFRRIVFTVQAIYYPEYFSIQVFTQIGMTLI